MRNFLKRTFDLRQERFWRLLLVLGAAFRFWNVIFFRNPMNLIFSDAGRHWDNARHFLTPGPMGASNPYFYQLYLYLARIITNENKTAMGLIAVAQSILYPLFWYLFARCVMRRRINALRFAALISFVPTHISMFSFFMNESLLFPLLGLSFWATWKASYRRSWQWFTFASALWVMAVLTRSVVMPVGGLTMLWAWLRQPRKVVSAGLAFVLLAVGYIVPSIRAYPVLHRYTPFGDNENVAIYFYSGAHDYTVRYNNAYTYIYASPSLYIEPFEPFFKWKSERRGNYFFTIDSKREGSDVKKTLKYAVAENRSKLPRMIYENMIFLAFGHSWPDAGKGNPAGEICLWERWIWAPLILLSLYRSIRYMRRRGPALVPALSVLFTMSLFASQVALMEGRYRKPIEPMVLLALCWLAEAKRSGPAFKGA